MRFEDIDTPRLVSGARENQLKDLETLGMVPDRSYIQSARIERHFALFERAVSAGALYACTCSRREVQESLRGFASAPHGALPIYTGHCRAGTDMQTGPGGVAWRFRASDESGSQDFIVARTESLNPEAASFMPAYHWACAIDDFDGDYKLLVRASDLSTSIPFQRAIHDWIARSEGVVRAPPSVFHASLVVQNDGHRLEKRTPGVTLSDLITAGWTPDRVLALFSASYAAGFPPLPEASIFGEALPERTLANLGF